MSREFWSGTVLTVKGPSRGGFAEQAYASFLCSPSMCKDVLKQGLVLKKAKRTERWLDRFVVLRAAFLTIAHSETTQGSMSKVYQIMRVVDGQQQTDLVIYPSNHDECENIQLRCPSAEDKQAWKQLMLQGLDYYHEVLAQTSGRMARSVLPEPGKGPPPGVATPTGGSSPQRRAHMAGNNPARRMMKGRQHENISMLRQAGSEDDDDVYSPPSPQSVVPRTIHSPPSDPMTPERIPTEMTVPSQSGSESDLSVIERPQNRGELGLTASSLHAEPSAARDGGKIWEGAKSAGVQAGRGGIVVGAFWHSSGAGSVAAPPGCGHASAVNAVQAFASDFGNVDAVRVLTGDDDENERGSSSDDGLLEELQEGDSTAGSTAQIAQEVLTWLWDRSAVNADPESGRSGVGPERAGAGASARGEHLTTLVLLTNLTTVANLVKRVMSRGVRVVLVSDSELRRRLAHLASAATDGPGHSWPQPKLQHFHASHVWTHLSNASGGPASAWTSVATAAAAPNVLEALRASTRTQGGLGGGCDSKCAASQHGLPPQRHQDAALLAKSRHGLNSHLHTPYTPPISPHCSTPNSLSEAPTSPPGEGSRWQRYRARALHGGA